MGQSSASLLRRAQEKYATMVNINNASNQQLDELAQQSDATQGQAVLRRVYDFLGRFVGAVARRAKALSHIGAGCMRSMANESGP
jgi:hypothetical protein